MSLLDLISEARLLGPRDLGFRVGWEFVNRTGLRAILEPVGELPEPDHYPDFESWRARFGVRHPLTIVRRLAAGEAREPLERLLSVEAREEVSARADAVERGELLLFRAFSEPFGTPPDWHLEPRRRLSWPRTAHWSTLLSHEDRNGDIKLTWEANRFVHVYDLIRAYALDGRSSRARTFATHLASWEAANPFRAGVNWASGQELAVRVLAWSYGVAAFGSDPGFVEADFRRFTRLAYAHAIHIEQHLGFARRAVANNHLLAEAMGLLVVAESFDFERSEVWREKAWAILEGPALEQFDADGGYCQNSHTYARFALEMWLEVVRWSGRSRYRFLGMIARAGEFLRRSVSPNGRLPNWGNNDGSTLTPWTSCAYEDFRPILTAVRSLSDGERGFEPGPWDEAILWRFGVDAIDAPGPTKHTERSTFPAAGLHIAESGSARAILRCGPMHRRTGHADQLHLDVWFGDAEVACDAGSYSYHADPEFHRWASGAASHNVVTVDGIEPMRLTRKFKWSGFEPGRLLEIDAHTMRATWPVFEAEGVRWIREVAVTDLMVEVVDRLTSVDQTPFVARLHWLLSGASWEPDGERWRRADGAEVEVTTSVPSESDFVIGHDGTVRGWQSREYGLREPCGSLMVAADGLSVEFRTVFGAPDSR